MHRSVSLKGSKRASPSAESKVSVSLAPNRLALTYPSVEPDEDVSELLALKQRMDPEGNYVGQSLAVLKLFSRIKDLNQLSDEPVVLLGPSGSGKTKLARIVHLTSNRATRSSKFLRARDVSGAAATIVRDKWVGRG